MANTNCLEGVACPNCGQDERFEISARVWATVTDDGTEDQGGDYEWTDADPCVCTKCDFRGVLGQFSEAGRAKLRLMRNPLDGGGPQATITTGKVDVALLRFQRDALLKELDTREPDELGEVMTGLVNLLDSMLDDAEGIKFFPVMTA